MNWENAALLGYADAVEAGRRGRRRDADRLFAAADTALADLPWWRHRVRLLVADAALTDGWGDPIGWAREALPVFAARGDSRLASCCRELLRRAGAPVPRPGRGDTPVPPALRAIGVTSREVDVLQLMADGLTNTGIAQKLVLSPAHRRDARRQPRRQDRGGQPGRIWSSSLSPGISRRLSPESRAGADAPPPRRAGSMVGTTPATVGPARHVGTC